MQEFVVNAVMRGGVALLLLAALVATGSAMADPIRGLSITTKDNPIVIGVVPNRGAMEFDPIYAQCDVHTRTVRLNIKKEFRQRPAGVLILTIDGQPNAMPTKIDSYEGDDGQPIYSVSALARYDGAILQRLGGARRLRISLDRLVDDLPVAGLRAAMSSFSAHCRMR